VCLTSKFTDKDTNGKAVKIGAKTKFKDNPELTGSILTNVCYKVSDNAIEKFFSKAGLRAAWEKVSFFLRAMKPEFIEYFDYIDEIRRRVPPP
jgi:hypothetical protein